ncbi:cytochrome P450 [Planctellipticum variicoloris]|jgi:cytochrome P450|uniref:cytochrome P450 n=1 Tax=Planctellipticum variicoloris TaxID=3064265 RepID=UPI002C7A0108|nr:cytochrome P450 [Planctomycetaceae bacterium SH412]HTN03520.1 cytochrome P450 [Planctomycetaceae bacterium]
MAAALNLAFDDEDGRLPVTVGRLLDFSDDPLACMRRQLAEHGPISALQQDGQRVYFAFGPEYNHRLLAEHTQFLSQFFTIRGGRNTAQRRLSSGLLSMNGEQHKRNRRLVMDAFQKRAMQGYLPAIQRLTEGMLADWQPGQQRDISRDMTEFMLRLTSSMLFGLDQPELAWRIGRMIDRWVHLNHEVGMGAFVSDPQFAERYAELLEFADTLEAEIRGMIALRKAAVEPGTDALSLLIAAHDEHGSISDDELVGQAALLFGAAHLTTANTFTWTLFLLAQHPACMERLHAELQRELTGGFPSPQQSERLVWTDAVIKESMRLMPASAYLQRTTAEPCQLGPFSLPKGAPIIFSQLMTHHQPELFPQPRRFRPERWQGLNPSPYAYLPFGAGPRMCIGGPLAMLILKMVLPTILQRFKLTVVPYAEINARIVSTMLCAVSPVRMQVDAPDGRFTAQPVRGSIHSVVDLGESMAARRAA